MHDRAYLTIISTIHFLGSLNTVKFQSNVLSLQSIAQFQNTVHSVFHSWYIYVAIVTPASSTSRPTTVTSDPTSPSEDEEGGGGGLLEGIPVGTIAIAASCVGLVLIFLAMLAVITCCICCRRSKHITGMYIHTLI